jgi:hypothetical protein
MNELDLLIENYFTESFETSELFRLVEQVMEEELYYKDKQGELKGPISDVNKVANDIVKFVKRSFPENYRDADLKLKRGARVLIFTNFGNLSTRDDVIRKLATAGFLSEPEVKRSKMYHRATTNFVDITPSGKQIPIVVQFDQGGGPAAAGGSYEQEMEDLMNNEFQKQQKPYVAAKQGGSTANPDIVVFRDGEDFVKIESKTAIGADFGQFKIERGEDGLFTQISQKTSPELVKLFGDIKETIDNTCPVNYDPEKSGDLTKFDIKDLAERVERYYQEKGVDYIVVDDMIYLSSDKPTNLGKKGVKRFKDAAEGGFVRTRVKCHGKSYSTTVAMKFTGIETSAKYYDPEVFNTLFP